MLWHLTDVFITFLFLPSHVRTSTTCVLLQKAVSWFQQNQVSKSHPRPNPCHRNLFAERKYVEEYRWEDAERELGLDRAAAIRLALLLGSDYTEGCGGIGIVNAVEARK